MEIAPKGSSRWCASRYITGNMKRKSDATHAMSISRLSIIRCIAGHSKCTRRRRYAAVLSEADVSERWEGSDGKTGKTDACLDATTFRVDGKWGGPQGSPAE